MAEPILLNDPLQWEQVYSETKFGTPMTGYGKRYLPIPPYLIPTLFDSHIIAAQTLIPNAGPRWRVGCWVQQILDPSPISGLQMQAREFTVPPNRAALLVFPRLTNQFKLQVRIPWWHEELTLQIYQYNGAYNTRIEELVTSQTDVIRVDLARIETKINAL
ncbi:MAG: hypothetical protein HC827_10005 [Cyanobacteria bacterium RM1_2_2]|nr:hypothetical protein [Cyanobacteria bacterium RM1_2_2]